MTTVVDGARPGTTSEGGERRGVFLVFVGLMTAMLLAALDQTIFSTALPTIVGELDGVDHMLWVTTAYILASTIMMPVYGKLGDLIGRKNIFIGAISLFMAGSVIGGLAHSMTWLIVGRAVQGLGGGGLMILSMAIIADVVPARQRGKYMGVLGGVFALASVAGPLLGGYFTEGIGWRWAFWMNLPLGALAILAAVFFLHPNASPSTRPRIDIAGIMTLAVASAALVLTSVWGGTTYDWDSWQILGLIALTLAAVVAFVFAERRATEPVMPLHLFAQRNFVLTTIAGLIIGVAMFGAMAYLPTYLQMVTGSSATKAGLLMIPMMGAMLVTSTLSGALVSRSGRYKYFPIAGSAVIAVALWLLSTMTADTEIWVTCCYLAVMGLGLGLSMQILVLIVQNTFPGSMVGTATAANNYFRQIGASLGSAVVGTIFANRLADHLSGSASAVASAGGANSLTPDAVKALPEAVRSVIVNAYSDSLAPVFGYLMPLLVIAVVLLLFVVEKPLATSIAAVEAGEEALETAAGVVQPAISAETVDTVKAATIPAQGVYGRISGGASSALAGARVTLADHQGHQLGRTTTAADGRYAIATSEPGSYLLIVSAPGLAPQASLVTLTDQPLQRDVVLAGTAWISGRVLEAGLDGAGSQPVSSALVTLTDVQGRVVDSRHSGADGGYVFENLASGGYVLTAQSTGRQPSVRSVEVSGSAATSCDLTLQQGARLEGVVLAADDRQPVRQASVTLLDGQGRVAGQTVTGADGSYRFDDLADGDYVLTASGYAPIAQQVQVSAGSTSRQPVLLGSVSERSPEAAEPDLVTS